MKLMNDQSQGFHRCHTASCGRICFSSLQWPTRQCVLVFILIQAAILLTTVNSIAWGKNRVSHRFGRPNLTTGLRGGDLKSTSVPSNQTENLNQIGNKICENPNNHHTFEWLSDSLLYNNWRTLTSRHVKFNPSGKIVDFEIVGQKGTDRAVLVFCWDRKTKTATMITEYMPSVHSIVMGLAAGMVEEHKHTSEDADLSDDLIAAQHELEEECRMVGGTWIKLTECKNGVTFDKYSTTRLDVYLVLDAVPKTENVKPRDEQEEGMEVHSGVTIEEIRRKIIQGEMTVVGSWACLLALEKLRELGEIQ